MEISTNRSHIIDRMQSRMMSVDEFNYDHLMAPPLYSFLTQYDIDQLRYIATSIRYSGKINQKYKAIDQIMNARGFVKLVAGTNRVCYRHLEYDDIVVKVAVDAVGIHDNPEEFKNQHIFKPFVTKVFEVSPCGTVGLFERVIPITSREEFMSVANEIFDVISNWFIGEYVLADIGTKFFMNWGIRKGFGPVLLDFPYCYTLDGNKLYCRNPDPTNPTGFCDGVIDYDDGYNFLYCTKCGTKYKATDLKKAVETKQIMIKGGTNKMAKELIVSVRKVEVDKYGNKIETESQEDTKVDFKPAVSKITKAGELGSSDVFGKELKVSVRKVPVSTNKNDRKKFRNEKRQEYKQQMNNNREADTSMKRGTIMNSAPSMTVSKEKPEPVETVEATNSPVPVLDPDDVILKKGSFGYFSSLDKEHGIMFVTILGIPFAIKLSSIPDYVITEISGIEDVQLELENAKCDLQKAEENLEAAKSELSQYKDKLYALESLYNERLDENDKLKEQNKAQQSNLQNYMEICTELETKNNNMEKEVVRLGHIIDDKKREINAANAELSNLRESYNDLVYQMEENASRTESDVNNNDSVEETTDDHPEDNHGGKDPSSTGNYDYNGIWELDSKILKVKDCIDIYKVNPENVPQESMDKSVMILKTKTDGSLLIDNEENLIGVMTIEGEDLNIISTEADEAEALYHKYAETIPEE